MDYVKFMSRNSLVMHYNIKYIHVEYYIYNSTLKFKML